MSGNATYQDFASRTYDFAGVGRYPTEIISIVWRRIFRDASSNREEILRLLLARTAKSGLSPRIGRVAIRNGSSFGDKS
jgi:hypothetical protein